MVDVFGDVAVMRDVCFGVVAFELDGVDAVHIHQDQCDHLVGVCGHPEMDLPKPVLKYADIEQSARRMAKVDLASIRLLIGSDMDLRREQSHSSIELNGAVEELVSERRESSRRIAQERRVMRSKMRDLIVRSVAQLRGVVARSRCHTRTKRKGDQRQKQRNETCGDVFHIEGNVWRRKDSRGVVWQAKPSTQDQRKESYNMYMCNMDEQGNNDAA